MPVNELPDSWIRTELGNLLYGIQAGKSVKCDERPPVGDEKGLVKISAVTWGEFDEQESKTLTNTEHLLPSQKISIGDLLISRANTLELVGATALVKSLAKNLYLSDKVLRLETDEEFKSLIHQFLRSREGRKQIESLATGNQLSMRNISQSALQSIQIPLPPVAEQKIITVKLDTLLAQVENTKARLQRIPKLLKRFRQSVLAAAVSGELTEDWRVSNPAAKISTTDYDRILKSSVFNLKAKNLPEPQNQASWLSCSIGHIFNVKSGDGLTAKEMNSEGEIPVYGGNGVNGYHDKSNIDYRAVVIGRVGFYCGSVHMTEERAWVTDNALIASYPESLITRAFSYWLLTATNLREDAASSAQPVISGAKIYPIQIALPPLEEQTEIVRRVEQLFACADSIEQRVNSALTRVEKLTQSILAKAFRGELTADWRAQNPDLISGENSAAALLERIKAERAAVKPVRKTRKRAAT